MTTAAALELALTRGDVHAVVELLAPLDEDERRALAPIANAMSDRENDVRRGTDPGRRRAATTAVFGTGTLREVLQCGPWVPAQVVDVLLARRPAWLAAWATMNDIPEPMKEWTLVERWPIVRALERAGAIDHIASENYALGLMSQARKHASGALTLLERDEALCERDIWDLFVYEGTGQISLSAVDKYTSDDFGWAHAFETLAARGKLSRERLLDATLDALERDWIQFRSSWFSRLHETLRPTLAERAHRVPRYVRLLGSRITSTVAFALYALAPLATTHETLPAQTLAALEGAYRLKPRRAALIALDVAERLLERHNDAVNSAATVIPALEHPVLEVQTRALDLIERYGRHDAALRERVGTYSESIAPSLRERVRTLAMKQAPAKPAEPAFVLAEFRRSRIGSIDDVDTLIEVASSVLEGEPSPEEIERFLGAVASLCDRRPAQFERLTGPLRKRVALFLRRPSGGVLFTRRLFAAVIDSWLNGTVHDLEAFEPAGDQRADVSRFLLRRILEICARVATGRAAPLLATPTTSGCTIDPREFAERCMRPESRFDRYDTIAALLRLQRQNRRDAVSLIRSMPTDWGALFRYALGEDEKVTGHDAAFWYAASRARDPVADDPEVRKVFPDFVAGATLVPSLALCWKIKEFKYRPSSTSPEQLFRVPTAIVTIDPPAAQSAPPDMPTVTLFVRASRESAYSRIDALDELRWTGTIWPAYRDAWFASGCRDLADNINWSEARWADRAFLEPLLDGDVPIGAAARTLLAIGLLAKDPAQGVLAVDAVTAALRDSRLPQPQLEGLINDLILWAPYTTTKRAIPRLEAIGRTSPFHARALASAIATTTQAPLTLKPALAKAFSELQRQLEIIAGD